MRALWGSHSKDSWPGYERPSRRLTVDEVAEALGVSPAVAHEWVDEGRLTLTDGAIEAHEVALFVKTLTP